MFYAFDQSGNRIAAECADPEEQYICPVCRGAICLKNGMVKVAHFAHLNGSCTDSWNYDNKSEWHRKMQAFFPEENQECVVTINGKTHRADVLVGKTVIEIQHSPITAEEFDDRNTFFTEGGYRIAWIFDMRERFENKQIEYLNDDDDQKFKWSHPMQIFSTLPRKLSDYDSQFALYFHLFEDEDEDGCDICRVVWARNDYERYNDLSRFCTQDLDVHLSKDEFDCDELFMSSREKKERYIKIETNKLNQLASKDHFSYSVRFIGKKGGKRQQYICPKTPEKFGLKRFGSTGCSYCKYCYMMVKNKIAGKDTFDVYCCHPHPVREPHHLDSDYVCECAPEY